MKSIVVGKGKRQTRTAADRSFIDHPPSRKVACCLCGGKPCFRMVGTRGYCRNHVAEAFLAVGARPPERVL